MAEPRSNKKSFRTFELNHVSPVQLLPYRMAEHRVSSQQANPTPANTYPYPVFHQLQGQVRRVAFLTHRRRLTIPIVLQNPHVTGDHQEGVHREGVPQLAGNVIMQNEMQYPPHIDAPDYNVSHYHPPPPHVRGSYRIISFLSDSNMHNIICRFRKLRMCKRTIGMSDLLNLSQLKHTLSLRCVGPFFSMYLSNQIIWCRRLKRGTMGLVLTSLRLAHPKLFPASGPTQPHLRTRHRQGMA